VQVTQVNCIYDSFAHSAHGKGRRGDGTAVLPRAVALSERRLLVLLVLLVLRSAADLQ
jgi:hypothetical protein